MEGSRVFPRPFRRGEDLSPHMGGPLRGDIDIMGEPNSDRLYHTLKVLLLLLLLCISQFQA